jgi:hypothetical protein
MGRTFNRVQASGIDIMLALDVSRSMLAEDFQIGATRAKRIDAVKRITQAFIAEHSTLELVSINPLIMGMVGLISESSDRPKALRLP